MTQPLVTILKWSEVRQENAKLRLDPEFFDPAAQAALSRLRRHRKFADLVKSGYRVVYENTKIVDRRTGIAAGLPFFLQATDIETPFINDERMGCVSESDWIRYRKGRIVPGEVLIEVKGRVEKVALVPHNFPIRTLVSGSCYKMQPKDPLDGPLLAAFLSSPSGQALKNRLKSNLLVSFISKDDLYNLPVPEFGQKLKEAIADKMAEAQKVNEQSKKAAKAGSAAFVESLGLTQWRPSNPNSFARSSKDVFNANRLDPAFFQEKYSLAHDALRSKGVVRFRPLDEFLVSVTNGATPLAHDLSKGDVLFLGAEHVLDFECNYNTDRRIMLEHHANENARTALRDGDLLMTIKGRVGNMALVQAMPQATNINQDVALLRFTDEIPIWYLMAFINSTFGRLETERLSTGGINPFLGLANVRRIRIPILQNAQMTSIGEFCRQSITRSNQQQARAKDALAACQEAIEIGIAKSEPAALRYLEQQGRAAHA